MWVYAWTPWRQRQWMSTNLNSIWDNNPHHLRIELIQLHSILSFCSSSCGSAASGAAQSPSPYTRLRLQQMCECWAMLHFTFCLYIERINLRNKHLSFQYVWNRTKPNEGKTEHWNFLHGSENNLHTLHVVMSMSSCSIHSFVNVRAGVYQTVRATFQQVRRIRWLFYLVNRFWPF